MLELRTTLRGLCRTPGFTFTAILVLGLGLGANTVLFNAVHALLWRPLPFPSPDRLVVLRHQTPRGNAHYSSSGRNVADLSDHVPSVAEVGLVGGAPPLAVVIGDEPVDLVSAAANSGYFRALALQPIVGQVFDDQDDNGTSAERRAVLTESAWRRHFAADSNVAGRVIPYVDGAERRNLRILGVVPDRTTLPYLAQPEVLIPIAWRHADIRANRGNLIYQTVIRLKPGVELEAVSSEAATVLANSEKELPEHRRGTRSSLVPLRAALVSSRTPVWLLYAAAGLLLLLTTVNAASLFLARAVGRIQETAIRGALGASLARTVRAHVLEAGIVCGLGLAVAFGLNAIVRPYVPELLPELRAVGPRLLETGPTLIAFGLVTCCVVVCAVALLPVMQARRQHLAGVLSQGGRTAAERTSPWRAVLASSQLAVILVLLAIGSLIGRSLVAALETDPGFKPANVVTFRAVLPIEGEEARVAGAYEMASLLGALPGISDVSFANESPLGTFYSAAHSTRTGDFQSSDPMVAFRLVDDRYFAALGARLVEGRGFTEAEVRQWGRVAVLNQAAVRLLFDGADPIGRTVHASFGGALLTIVGVVEDLRTSGLDATPPPMIYRPYMPFGSGTIFSVRTGEPASALEAAVRARVKTWNAGVLLRDFQGLEGQVQRTVRARVRASALVGSFALLGLIIGAVGFYGTIAADVLRLRKEIGIRMALGATTIGVLLQVLARGGRLVAWGSACGLCGAAAAAGLLRRQFYGIGPFDVVSFAAALLLLAAAATIAMLVPALRAARLDPAEALRGE